MSNTVDISYGDGKWVITANAVDITRSVRGLSMMVRGDDRMPEITLDIVGVSGLTTSEIRKHRLPAQSHAALTALGWTPPPPGVKP